MSTILEPGKAASPRPDESHCRGTMMSQGSKRKIKVVAEDPHDGTPVKFRLDSDLKDPTKGQLVFNKTRDNMKKKDYYTLEFELDDHTSLNLKFAPNPMKAFWVSMGDALAAPRCPQSSGHCDDIYATAVEEKKLTVRNDDAKIQYFAFSLGFIGDPNESEYRFDPIGQNQNGGS